MLLYREILKMAGDLSKRNPRQRQGFRNSSQECFLVSTLRRIFSSQRHHFFLERLCRSNVDQLDDWQLLSQLLPPRCTILHSTRANPSDRPQLIDAIRHRSVTSLGISKDQSDPRPDGVPNQSIALHASILGSIVLVVGFWVR